MTDILVYRFERYFRHRDPQHEILSLGDQAVACRNIRNALSYLGDPDLQDFGSELYDKSLEAAVRKFQKGRKHKVVDGRVGPNTRTLLIEALLVRFEPNLFIRMQRPDRKPSVFLSYAWKDSSRVNKLDQWLRDHNISVMRDDTWFKAGETIPENILRAVAIADKTVIVFSANSKDRHWPAFERKIAEDLEQRLKSRILIYVALDNSPLPPHDPDRIAIVAKGRPLKEIGHKILHALVGSGIEPSTFVYDENEPL